MVSLRFVSGDVRPVHRAMVEAAGGKNAPLLPRRLTSANLRLVDLARNGQFAQLMYSVSA
jgi:hypothetical protein